VRQPAAAQQITLTDPDRKIGELERAELSNAPSKSARSTNTEESEI
jgi:hypothetical protein